MKKMVNFPTCTKSDSRFNAGIHTDPHTHTHKLYIEKNTPDWFRPTSKNYELKHKSEIFILLKRDSSFFHIFFLVFSLAPLFLLSLLSTFFRLSGAFFTFYKNCMWNEKFDLPRESSSSFQLRFFSQPVLDSLLLFHSVCSL